MSKVTKVRCWPNSGNPDWVLARGDFVVFDAVKISYTLCDGQNGPYVRLPQRTGNKEDPKTGKPKRYYDVWVDDDALRNEIQTCVLAEYDKETGGATSQGSAPGPSDQTKSPVPF